MNKKQRIQIKVIISFMIFALVTLVTWQIKGVKKTNEVDIQLSNRVDVLQQEYKNELEKNEDLLDQISTLQNDIARYRAQISEEGGAVKLLQEDLARAETVAGLTDVVGNGIVITLNDGQTTQLPEGIVTEGYGIVHDSFILTLLNEIRAAGAEAISINDERVLATTEIRCAGPTISINNVKKAAPFEIKVIGDPETLENALKMPGGTMELAQMYGIDVSIKKTTAVLIKKHIGLISYKYAQEVQPEVTE